MQGLPELFTGEVTEERRKNMDMNELGYFLYMDAMEKKQKEESSLNPFAADGDEENDEEDKGQTDW